MKIAIIVCLAVSITLAGIYLFQTGDLLRPQVYETEATMVESPIPEGSAANTIEKQPDGQISVVGSNNRLVEVTREFPDLPKNGKQPGISNGDLAVAFAKAEKDLADAKSKEDHQRVFEKFKKLAAQGHPESQRRTADLLAQGLGVDKDEIEAYHYYSQAAEAGDALAQYQLATYLEKGLVTDPDPEAAYNWYQKAADQNLPDAWAQLGRLISEGTLVESDYELALDYYKKAEGMGSQWGTFYKATALLEGWGVGQNVEEAIGIMKSLGNNGFHQAQAALYILYNEGKLVAEDPIQALEWLTLATMDNDSTYKSALADALYKGDVVPQDIRKAFNLLEESALDGQVEALYRLSLLSLKEAKSPEGKKRATELLELAAEYGHQNSQMLIAYYYANAAEAGEGKQAYDWTIAILTKAEDNYKAQYALKLHRIDGVPLKTAITTAIDSEYVERQNYDAELELRGTKSRQPRVIHYVDPKYPQGLLLQDFTGQVTVIMIIDETGNPTRIQIEDSPHPALTESAIEAVEQWKFDPAIKDGKPASSKVRIPLSFDIRL